MGKERMASSRPLHIQLHARQTRVVRARTPALQRTTRVRRTSTASVQCYAIEGRYPPSVEYLEENYGVQINRKKYNVFYDGFASNVMPEINIIPIEEQGASE